MPLYEYKCRSCGKTFEIIQKFSDVPLTVHEGCGGQVERLISPSALKFKGTGWYVNDYGSGNGKRKSAESKKETTGSADSSPKTETKSTTPAAPSDKKK
jgi:putative FmdB family regulatory protein